jgi:signal transduction histidine kinase
MTIFRRPVRSRPIRLFLITMFAVPLVSLAALWAFAASITVRTAVSDHTYNASVTALTTAIEPLTIELPAEREASYLWLISGRRSAEAPVLATRKLVDGAIPTARSALQSGSLFAGSRSSINALFAQLGQLARIRSAIDSGAMSPSAAFQAYSGMLDAEFRFFKASIQYRASSLSEVSIGTVDSAYAYEMARREATLVDGALADRGQMSASARQLFASSAASRSLLMNDVLAFLTAGLRAPYLSVVSSPEYQKYQAMEHQILASSGSSGPIPVSAAAWQAASGSYLGALLNAELKTGTGLAAMSASLSDRLVTEAALAGGAGLLGVIVSVILLVWFGRKVTRDLTRLDRSVRGMAQERLPRVVERLWRGDDVDVLAESPPPDTSTIQEIARIAESFGTVQTAAVTAAVDQAKMRKGVNQVFLNISMRSQSLLHRQLATLDSMERRTSEPAALADLFRLDHLTTRMRRHAEGLIILSGATPGRGWRDPVPVVDVLRGAVAEVEDYVRVDVLSESRDLVAGRAVNDVIHLIAELIENGTVFSPPNTTVEVRGDRVGAGFVAEIEDRGLGLSAEELADINGRLASPPEFDLADSEQLGLFVVARLAARHNIKVSLRPSVYGGTTAVVLLPFGVIVWEEDVRPVQDRRDRPPALTGAPDVLPGSPWPVPAPDESGAGQPDESGAGQSARTAAGSLPASRPAPVMPGRPMTAAESTQAWDRRRPEVPRISPGVPGELEQAAPQARAALPPPLTAQPRPPSALPPPPAAQPRPPSALPPPPAAPGITPPAAAPGTTPPPWAAGPMTSWPGAFEPRAARRGSVPSGTHLGMPIRVPQASLVPQLRARRKADTQAMRQEDREALEVREAHEVRERTPEVTGTMMALMQQGWQRGRADDLDHPEGAPGNGTD